MAEKQTSHGTSEMKEPQTIKYNTAYKITPLFMNDFKKTMEEISYADYKRLEPYVSSEIIPISRLNEFIRALSLYPYKYIAPLMRAMENKDNFTKYFEVVSA